MYTVENSEFNSWADKYTGPKFHAVLCDPPYSWNFLGRKWDNVTEGHPDFASVASEWGESLKKVLYPGAIVLMFAGPRTAHHVAYGMERAGYLVWDKLIWFYVSGMPKGQDMGILIDKHLGVDRTDKQVVDVYHDGHVRENQDTGKRNVKLHTGGNGNLRSLPATEAASAWDGFKTASLKPAYEEVLCFRLPSNSTYADVAITSGAGALNIASCRVGNDVGGGWGGAGSNGYRGGWDSGGSPRAMLGRFPSNLLLNEGADVAMDQEFGERKSGGSIKTPNSSATKDIYGKYDARSTVSHTDTGGISRWFFCSKASTKERNEGVEGGNTHVAVKPIGVCEWLAKLLLPPDVVSSRRLLVPFSGSGSEMIGAVRAGWDEVIGVEMLPEHCAIANQRLAHWSKPDEN